MYVTVENQAGPLAGLFLPTVWLWKGSVTSIRNIDLYRSCTTSSKWWRWELKLLFRCRRIVFNKSQICVHTNVEFYPGSKLLEYHHAYMNTASYNGRISNYCWIAIPGQSIRRSLMGSIIKRLGSPLLKQFIFWPIKTETVKWTVKVIKLTWPQF